MRFFELGGWPAFIVKFTLNHRLLLLELSLTRTCKLTTTTPQLRFAFDGSLAGLETACNEMSMHPELSLITGAGSMNSCLAAVQLLPKALDKSDLGFASSIQVQKDSFIVAEFKNQFASQHPYNLLILDLVHFENLVHRAILW